MKTSETTSAIFAALCAFQSECGPVSFDSSNKFLGNKYASLTAQREHTRPMLGKHGLAVVQGVEGHEMLTRICHISGEWLEFSAIMPELAEEKGKSGAQVMGSIITYMRRYAYASALGLVSDEDNDGNKQQATAVPAKKPVPTAKQIAKVAERIAHGEAAALVGFFGAFDVSEDVAIELLASIDDLKDDIDDEPNIGDYTT
jgi:hypothetical protein